MNNQISSYERRLRKGSRLLDKLESSGDRDQRYNRMLRHWLELLAAYEYESEVAESGSPVEQLTAIG